MEGYLCSLSVILLHHHGLRFQNGLVLGCILES